MKTLLIFLASATVANAANAHFERVADMLINQEYCSIRFNGPDLKAEVEQGALAEGVTVPEAADVISRMVAAKSNRIDTTIGSYAYCAPLR